MTNDAPFLYFVCDGQPAININLLAEKQGYSLTRFRRVPPQQKSGGVWADNALADGRELVYDALTNGSIEMDLSISASLQDTAITFLNDLVNAMFRARAYWTERLELYPVYIRSRGPKETNISYLLVKNIIIPELPDYYRQPFAAAKLLATLEKITVLVEYGDVTGNPPGMANDIAISAVETFNSLNLGNTNYSGVRVPTTSGVYVGNRRIKANLTHIYTHNSTTGSWSGNKQADAFPVSMLSAPFAVGDAIYFGVQSTLADTSPLWNLIFDLDHGVTDLTLTWQAYVGSWANISAKNDKTNGLMVAGISSLNAPVNDLTTANLQTLFGGSAPNITGYWIRARVTAVGASPNGLTQENRRIYSAIWPYVQIEADQITGDLPALACVDIENVGEYSGVRTFSRIIISTRKTARGTDFTPFINLSDEQNPTGITVTAVGAGSTFANNADAPTGRVIEYTSTAAQAMATRAEVVLGSSICSQYHGDFRLLARISTSSIGSAGDGVFSFQAKITSGSGGTTITNPLVLEVPSLPAGVPLPVSLIDFGEIFLPLGMIGPNEAEDEITIEIQASHPGTSTPKVNFHDLIFMPSDEFIGDFVSSNIAAQAVNSGEFLQADSVSVPKAVVRALVKDTGTEKITGYFEATTAYPITLPPTTQLRIYFLLLEYSSTFEMYAGIVDALAKVGISVNARYMGLRGTA